MKLPDLKTYREEFVKNGVDYPLKPVSVAENGLLKVLPPSPAGKAGWPWTMETDPTVYADRKIWPKITIVTPSYNQSYFLEETLRSVLLQNYPNLEYILIDGGSDDGTWDILEKYSPWISYWQSKKDNGQGQAINFGFSLASGDYYAWINSDDYYLKDVFHLVMRNFINNKISFLYGYGYGYSVEKNEFNLMTHLPLIDYFIKIPILIQPSCFWSAQIHKPIWEELYCSLDFELWLRLVRGQKRKFIRLPLSVAHIHSDAKTFDPKMKAKWDADHHKIWSDEAHGRVYEWNRIVFLNRIRQKVYKMFGWLK